MKKFKKIAAIVLASALTLTMATGVFAKGAPVKETKEKTVEVSLSVTSEQEFEVVYTGEEVELQAVTAKHGSSYEDNWSVLDAEGKVVDLDEYNTVLSYFEGVNSYVSTVTFVAEEAGTYTLKYSIEMAAGKSHVRFAGEAESDEIVVVDPDEAFITGVIVKNFNVTSQGNTSRAAGDIYFTMSEGDDQFAASFSNIVLNSGNNFTNTVEVEAEGTTYIITVTRTNWFN